MEREEWQDIGRRLVEYYERNARDLPWRTNPSPYRVLVSEVMLQQTVVGTVLGYFERWMERWPDPASLAQASEQEVLAFWQGLGYYQRASRLLQAARMIVEEFDGRVPDTRKGLRRLPGVGPYIADAVLSFAFRDLHPHDVSQVLDERNVCVRAGHHCAKPLMQVLGVQSTTRASFYLYNGHDDVDALADALDGATDIFGF